MRLMSCTSTSQAISKGLQENTGLVKLVLDDNEIGDQGGEAWGYQCAVGRDALLLSHTPMQAHM